MTMTTSKPFRGCYYSPLVEVAEGHPHWVAEAGDLSNLQHPAVLQLALHEFVRPLVWLLELVGFDASAQRTLLSRHTVHTENSLV